MAEPYRFSLGLVLRVTDRTFTIDELDSRRVLVRVVGTISQRDVEALREQLAPNHRDPGWELIFDFTELAGCSAQARALLADLQRTFVMQQVRTAFVTAHPRYRGMALWIAHVADDPNARSFYRMHQAEQWFASRESRAQSLTRSLERARGRRSTAQPPSERLRKLRRSRSPEQETNE